MTFSPLLEESHDAAGRVTRSAGPPWRVVLGAAALLAAGGGWIAGHGLAPAHPVAAEPALVMLLRFMAILKLGLALGATALTFWRITASIGDRLAIAYIAASALMLAAPGLIWSIAPLAAGALLFHGGLFVFLIAASRDPGAVRQGARALQARSRRARPMPRHAPAPSTSGGADARAAGG